MKKNILRLVAILLFLTMAIPGTSLADSREEQDFVCLGADLTEEQKWQVADLLDVDLDDVTVITVTNDEERDMLGAYISSDKIGTRSISSARVQLTSGGKGITVNTHNITWCTSKMYASALATAGVTDARITVAAPFQVSGTAALTGILKAYESAAGSVLGEDAKQTASEELVLTGTLADVIGQDEASDLIAYVKQEALEQGIDDPEKVGALVDKAADSLGVAINDSQKEDISGLVSNIVNLDIDPGQVYDQLDSIYQGMQKLGQVEEVASGALNAIGDFFKGIFDWFANLGK